MLAEVGVPPPIFSELKIGDFPRLCVASLSLHEDKWQVMLWDANKNLISWKYRSEKLQLIASQEFPYLYKIVENRKIHFTPDKRVNSWFLPTLCLPHKSTVIWFMNLDRYLSSTGAICCFTFYSVFAKRVLTYWENRGNPGYSHMNVFIVPMANYTFPKIHSFP